MARKRKNPDGTQKQPKSAKAVRRGIVKWAPPHIDGEDQASHDKHVTWLRTESKKRDGKRYDLISRKMDVTYSFRREYLTKNAVLLLQVKEKYPFLFDQQEVFSTYHYYFCQ